MYIYAYICVYMRQPRALNREPGKEQGKDTGTNENNDITTDQWKYIQSMIAKPRG